MNKQWERTDQMVLSKQLPVRARQSMTVLVCMLTCLSTDSLVRSYFCLSVCSPSSPLTCLSARLSARSAACSLVCPLVALLLHARPRPPRISQMFCQLFIHLLV